MHVNPSRKSFLRTIKNFWNGKRFLMLLIFALAWGNITLYCVGYFAKKQVFENLVAQQTKVYNSYLQNVERARKLAAGAADAKVDTKTEAKDVKVDHNKEAPANSPYWTALREIRKQYPQYRINVALEGSVEGEKDKRVLETLKNRPRGWRLTDESDGWARSFFVLPTQNTAALQTTAYIRDELNSWESLAVMLGLYAFLIFFIFGWFWTRALDSATSASYEEEQERMFEVQQRVLAIKKVVEEIGRVTTELRVALEKVEKGAGGSQNGMIYALDEIAAQIRMLSVNGSVEAARSADTYRVFHVLMQEINQLASRSREILGHMNGEGANLDMITEKVQRIDAIMNALINDAPNAPESGQGARHAG